jgi:broad specificity phosphatase PhoE
LPPPPFIMKLIFVRHGQTDFNFQGRTQGQEMDIPLNATGISQVEAAAAGLPQGIDLILSSPLKRAYQTAEILNRTLGKELLTNDALKEVKYGSLAGKTWAEIEAETGDVSMRTRDLDGTFDYRQYGGESMQDLMQRVNQLVEELKAKYPEKTILVTAHGGVIDAMHLLFSTEALTVAENASIHGFNF